MTEKIEVKATKTRGPRRSSAEIAADYKERAEKAERKARLESTRGLKEMLVAREALVDVCEATDGGPYADKASTLLGRANDLIGEMSK